jgi:hypothetical protein
MEKEMRCDDVDEKTVVGSAFEFGCGRTVVDESRKRDNYGDGRELVA